MVPDILSTDFFEVIIVGGGTCGLAVATRLCENTPGAIFTDEEHLRFHWLRQRTHGARTDKNRRRVYAGARLGLRDLLVLDATADHFLGQWDAQFSACQIPHLRSPMFFHPDPANVDGMVAWAHQTGREPELKEIPNVVGRELLKHHQKRMRRKSVRTQDGNLRSESHDRPGIVDVNMREWKDYYRPGTAFFHDFCRDLVCNYNLADRVYNDAVVDIRYGELHLYDAGKQQSGFIITTASGAVYCSNTCVVASGHGKKINYPRALLPFLEKENLLSSCHTTHIFNGAVAFPPPAVEKRLEEKIITNLVIVGGGLTSAQLAHVACSRGIPTTLLLRGPEKIKHFDFHLDWVTKYRNVKKASFYQLETDEERLQLLHDAREGGLVNPEYHMILKKHCSSGILRMMKHTTIGEAERVEGRWKLRLDTICSEKPSGLTNQKTLEDKTASVSPKPRAYLDPPSPTNIFTPKSDPVIKSNASMKSDVFSESDPTSESDFAPPHVTQQPDPVKPYHSIPNCTNCWINADYVCCATGVQADIEGTQFLKSVLNDFPIDTVGGYPCLTENLQWNDTLPLYMVGKNAALRVGPTSANLDGARIGAERVGWKIQHDRGDDALESALMETSFQIAENSFNRYTLLQEA